MRLMGCSVSLFEFGNTQMCRQMNAWGEWTEYKSDRNADTGGEFTSAVRLSRVESGTSDLW
jgi:hypothetical protein